MCDKAEHKDPLFLVYVPESLNTQQMHENCVEEEPKLLEFFPDNFKIQEMWKDAVVEDPWPLQYVPNHRKTQEMWWGSARNVFSTEICPWKAKKLYEDVVEEKQNLLKFVPDSFEPQKGVPRYYVKSYPC